MKINKIEASAQPAFAMDIKNNRGVLLTEWVSAEEHLWLTIYLVPEKGIVCAQSSLEKHSPTIEDLSDIFPVCNRLQRMIAELTHIPTRNAKDQRPWLIHTDLNYPFHTVSGDDVHEIPVGPVHAGIIEPGHFRFSVVGEMILKLEARLGYTHKGIHALLKNTTITEAHKLIGRVSGDSTVAYAYAFALACEQIQETPAVLSTQLERNILLERERIANHLGDIGAIINDASLPSLQSFFTLLKETLLQHNQQYYGHRYAMDCIQPFLGNPIDESSMKKELQLLKKEYATLQKTVSAHLGLQDRLQNTGVLSTELAEKLGVVGIVAKASGINIDVRKLLSDTDVFQNTVSYPIKSGDVSARVLVRLQECLESIDLIQDMIGTLQNHATVKNSQSFSGSGLGIGVVEGWRGPICVLLSARKGVIEWCHFHDPSWQNWLALEYAVLDNFVPDFPLINKSFNLSYSGQDS